MTAMAAPGEVRIGRRCRWGIGVVAVLAGLLLSCAADGAVAAPSATTTTGECLASGQVWLHLQTDAEGEVLRSACVGEPVSGLAALRAADVATSESRGGYLCRSAGYPEQCPTKFTGSYWQYWHTSSAGGEWQYSQRGAGAYSPERGSIEGWCYTNDEERCELPRLGADHTAVDRVDKEWPSETLELWVGQPRIVNFRSDRGQGLAEDAANQAAECQVCRLAPREARAEGSAFTPLVGDERERDGRILCGRQRRR